MKGFIIFETMKYLGSYEKVSSYEIIDETVYKDVEQAKERMLSRIKEIANEYDMLEDADFLSEIESIEDNCFDACGLFYDFDDYTIKIIELDNAVDNGYVFVELEDNVDFFNLSILENTMYKDIDTKEFIKNRVFEVFNDVLRVCDMPQYDSVEDEEFESEFNDGLVNEMYFRMANEIFDMNAYHLEAINLKMV